MAKRVTRANKQDVAEPKKVARRDGWINTLTGLGSSARDKRMSGVSQRFILSYPDLVDLYRGDDLAARIVEAIPDEMIREGWEMVIQEDEDDEDGTDSGTKSKDYADECGQWEREQGIVSKIYDALRYERAYGGAGIFIGVDDGAADLREPLNMDRIRTLDCLTVFDSRELVSVSYYTNPLAPKYGETQIYRIQPQMITLGPADVGFSPKELDSMARRKGAKVKGGRQVNVNGVPWFMPEVHESRILRFDGIHVNRRTRRENLGWGDSILVRCYEIMRDFGFSWAGAANLISDFAQAVIKIKGLAEILESNDSDALMGRLQAIDLSRSVARAILLDAENEDFERKTTPVAGLPDLLDKMCLRVAAAATMPVTLLMGQPPSGLNATGKSDMQWWYDRVAAMQAQKLKPVLQKLYEVALRAENGPTEGYVPDSWDIQFCELQQLSELDKADLRVKQSTADKNYLDSQVLTPTEVAISRFGGETYSVETVLDLEARAVMAKQEQARVDPKTGMLKPELGGPGTQPGEAEAPANPPPAVGTQGSGTGGTDA
jgi:phage-related protein (TIGR01555 family)